MAVRSPTEYHNYWGTFGSDADLPNVASSPNSSALLQEGDIAYVTTTNPGLYVCTAPTVGSASWSLLSTGGGAGGVRSAHVFVVAVDNALQSLSSVASPPAPANNGNLSTGVGDVVGVTCDYLDPGDGSELEQALLAAAAANARIDIRIRPGSMNITAAALSSGYPLVVPEGCRVQGAGITATRITQQPQASQPQQLFELDTFAELSDLTIESPGGNFPFSPTTVPGVIVNGQGETSFTLRNCRLIMGANNFATREQSAMVQDTSGTARILDCEFDGTAANGWRRTTGPYELRAIFFGQDSSSAGITPTRSQALVRGCRFRGFNCAVRAQNVFQQPVVSTCSVEDAFAHSGSLLCIHNISGQLTNGPVWSNVTVRMSNFSDPDIAAQSRVAFRILMDGSGSSILRGASISGCAAFFDTQSFNKQESNGAYVSSDGGSVLNTSITGLTVQGTVSAGEFSNGVRARATGSSSTINGLSVSGCQANASRNVGPTGGFGVIVGATSAGNIVGVVVSGCSLGFADSAGVSINGSGCVSSVVVGNSLSFSAAPTIDTGTGSVIANNS